MEGVDTDGCQACANLTVPSGKNSKYSANDIEAKIEGIAFPHWHDKTALFSCWQRGKRKKERKKEEKKTMRRRKKVNATINKIK